MLGLLISVWETGGPYERIENVHRDCGCVLRGCGNRAGRVRSIVVDLSGYDDDLEIGASVAIDGVCMTVVSAIDGHVRFEAIPETLERTTMGFQAG